jgi:hypothetical protein
MTRYLKALCLALTISLCAQQALAWGSTGHRMIAVLGVKSLGPDLPAFLKTPEALVTIGELAREPDRSKGAGRIHDAMRDPAHFVDLDDAGKVGGVLALEPLPPTRGEFDAALRGLGTDSSKTGYLPYAMIDGWQQLAKDFAYWRALSLAIPLAKTPQERAWLKADLARRQALIINNLGVWSHYVGDASQPLHVTEHFNGWGEWPNPKGYTQSRTIHARFEGQFVRENIVQDTVEAAMPAPVACGCSIEQASLGYLKATANEVEPLYALEKDGGFELGDARGKAFVTKRLAVGAASLRDMVSSAWLASETTMIGWPAISLADIASGKIDAFESLIGQD